MFGLLKLLAHSSGDRVPCAFEFEKKLPAQDLLSGWCLNQNEKYQF